MNRSLAVIWFISYTAVRRYSQTGVDPIPHFLLFQIEMPIVGQAQDLSGMYAHFTHVNIDIHDVSIFSWLKGCKMRCVLCVDMIQHRYIMNNHILNKQRG